MRKMVFSWTDARFPVSPGRADKFALLQHPIVTVVGKAFTTSITRANDTRSNRRNYDPSLAVWEIHPVMKLATGNSAAAAASIVAAPAPQVSAPTTPEVAAPPPVPSPPLVTFSPTAAASEQFVTITKPVTVQIPHGTTVLQPGMRLPVLSRDSQSVDVRYLDARYAIRFLQRICADFSQALRTDADLQMEEGFLFPDDRERQARNREKDHRAVSSALRNFGSPMRNTCGHRMAEALSAG